MSVAGGGVLDLGSNGTGAAAPGGTVWALTGAVDATTSIVTRTDKRRALAFMKHEFPSRHGNVCKTTSHCMRSAADHWCEYYYTYTIAHD